MMSDTIAPSAWGRIRDAEWIVERVDRTSDGQHVLDVVGLSELVEDQDVQVLGLALDELRTIYRVQFPVLRKYEQNTWYDQNGRIIYTKNRGLTGVGFKSKKWKEVKDMTSGTVERTIEDDTQPGDPVERTIVYEAPFTKCDREADYERAWGVFEGRG